MATAGHTGLRGHEGCDTQEGRRGAERLGKAGAGEGKFEPRGRAVQRFVGRDTLRHAQGWRGAEAKGPGHASGAAGGTSILAGLTGAGRRE